MYGFDSAASQQRRGSERFNCERVKKSFDVIKSGNKKKVTVAAPSAAEWNMNVKTERLVTGRPARMIRA